MLYFSNCLLSLVKVGDCSMSTNNPSDQQLLLTKIKTKRQQISEYLSKTEPRHSSLINSSIFASALAAALTAAPGVGGEPLISSMKKIVTFGIPIWQMLCILATILSTLAVIANGVLKSYNMTSKITSARSCDAKLEAIQTMLELGQVDVEEAAQDYTQCLVEIPHVLRGENSRR